MPLSFVERARRAALIAPLAVLGVAAISASSALAVPDPQSGGGTTSMSAAAPAVAAEAPARPAAPKPVATTLQADINLTTQQLTVTAGGKVLHVWPISSGRQGYETPRGSFRPQWAAKMHFSKKYDDAPMPHSVFFNGGIATHATQATGMLGRPASHGCVRLSPDGGGNLLWPGAQAWLSGDPHRGAGYAEVPGRGGGLAPQPRS